MDKENIKITRKGEEIYRYHFAVFTKCSIAGEIFAILSIGLNFSLDPANVEYVPNYSRLSSGEVVCNWLFECSRDSVCAKEGRNCWFAHGKGEPFDEGEMLYYLRTQGTVQDGDEPHLFIERILLDCFEEGTFDEQKVGEALLENTGERFTSIDELKNSVKREEQYYGILKFERKTEKIPVFRDEK